MTTIRRPTGDPRRRSPRGKSVCSCRNVFLFLIVCQVLSLMFSAMRSPSENQSDAPKQKQDHQYHGIEFVLSEFEMGKQRLISETEKRLGIMAPKPDEERARSDDKGEDDLAKDGDNAEDEDDEADNKGGDDEEGGDDYEEPSNDDGEEITDRGGITDGGYVVDYTYGRQYPSFRKEGFASKLEQDKESVEGLSQQTNLEPCLYYLTEQGGSDAVMRSMFHSSCLTDGQLIAYNSQSFPRIWCNKTISPESVKTFDEPCKEPVKLFSVDNPPVSAERMPHVVIRSSIESRGELEDVLCNIPCKQEKDMKGSARIIEGTSWKLIATMDDPSSNANARMERTDYRNDQYYSTTSFKSAVPQSFFSFDKYDLSASTAVDYDNTENAASYLVNDNCRAQASRRQKWLEGVKEHFTVAALGKCDHNTDTDLNVEDRADRMTLMKKYRFSLTFEAVSEKDYITEAVWEALQAGTIPVVVGAPNIMEHVPSNSVITTAVFQDFEALGKYLKSVAENKTLWESFHAWRSNPEEVATFDARYDFTRTSASCRTCRWAYAKIYGLGWNHTHQVVQENSIPRVPCMQSDKNPSTGPFRESWITRKAEETREEKTEVPDACDKPQQGELEIDVGGYTVHRGIQSHDGVVDIAINSIDMDSGEGDLVLRLDTEVKNDEGGHFPNPHGYMRTVHGPLATSISVQDERSRITVITNWDTQISSPEEGAIEILVHEDDGESMQEDETRIIRVVTEDQDTVNGKMTEFFPSSFLDMMTRDFVDPLLLFSANSR